MSLKMTKCSLNSRKRTKSGLCLRQLRICSRMWLRWCRWRCGTMDLSSLWRKYRVKCGRSSIKLWSLWLVSWRRKAVRKSRCNWNQCTTHSSVYFRIVRLTRASWPRSHGSSTVLWRQPLSLFSPARTTYKWFSSTAANNSLKGITRLRQLSLSFGPKFSFKQPKKTQRTSWMATIKTS